MELFTIWQRASIIGACLLLTATLPAQSNYVDFNNFGALKAFYSRNTSNFTVWDYMENECDGSLAKEVLAPNRNAPENSQSNFLSLVEGDISTTCLSFTTFEKPFFSEAFHKKNYKEAFSCATGIRADDLAIYRKDCNYFEEFVKFYLFLNDQSKYTHHVMHDLYSFSLIDSKRTFDETSQNENEIGVVLNIGGGHILGNSVYIENGLTGSEDYKNLVLNNVRKIKGSKPLVENTREYLQTPVFYLTLASQFDNGLCEPFSSSSQFKTTFNHPSKTNKSIKKGISELGYDVIEELLSETNGKRVLIDVSGMSLESRKDYYEFLDRRALSRGEVPIVASHSAISGVCWAGQNYSKKDDHNKNKNSVLNRWSSNLCKQDIHKIYESNGMIGITLDDSFLYGKVVEEEMVNTPKGSDARKKLFVKALLANMLTVVETIGTSSGWDIITIGSGFDNLVPFAGPYGSAAAMPFLKNDIITFLEQPEDIFGLYSKEDVQRLMFGFNPERLGDKLFSENASNFLVRELPDEQLATKLDVFNR